MNAVCVPLSLFPFELSLSTVTRPKSSNSRRLRIRVDKNNLHSPAQQLPQSSTGHLIPPFLPAKGKITLLVYFTREQRHYSDHWKTGFVNKFERVTVHLPSSIMGQNFDY